MNRSERPRLAPDARYLAVGSEGVLFQTESEGAFAVSGSLWQRLLPKLDGAKSVEELAEEFGNPSEVFEFYRALFLLKKRKLVEDGPAPTDPAELFWKASGTGARRVRIESIGGVSTELLERMLAIAEIEIDPSASITIVLTDDYRRNSLALINERQLQNKNPWLLMRCCGWRTWLGPVFTPGAGPCWECLASRLRMNQTELEFVEGLAGGTAVAEPLPSTAATSLLVSFAVPVIERVCLTRDAGALVNSIWTIQLDTFTHDTHHVVRRPQCPACGNPALAGGSADFHLQARPATAETNVESRSATPWFTYERFRHHISSVSGAVPELKPGLLDENPFHLFSSGANRATSIASIPGLLSSSLRSRSGGKGVSREQAMAGALAEALERYSCSWRGDSRAIRASLSELGSAAIDPRTILNFSAAQYDARDEINARGEHFYRVPRIFNPEQTIEWTPVRSLTDQSRRFVPTALCWFGHPADFAYADSNGCAAGNNFEEAIFQALCELVERDSVAIWWYNRTPRPAIDLKVLWEPWCGWMLETFRDKYGRVVEAIDLTTDIGVAAASVVSYRIDAEHPEFVFGLGAHPDPVVAVRRAFTEMCQLFGGLTARTGETRGPFARLCRNIDPGLAKWFASATRATQPQMIPTRSAQTSANPPRAGGAAQLDGIEDILRRLRSAGLDAFAMDCTQPDVGMPVARVFVPGLRHFWARFGPGRLYDVPVKLGLLTHQKNECDLNPIAMFF